MKYDIKLFEELETDTDISWWNVNREKINEAIRLCNEWQTHHRQDDYYGELVIEKVVSIRRWNEDTEAELNDWQLELLE